MSTVYLVNCEVPFLLRKEPEATRQGLTRGGVSADPVEGPVMLSAAKHLVGQALRTSGPQMLRCAQHDRRDGGCAWKISTLVSPQGDGSTCQLKW